MNSQIVFDQTRNKFNAIVDGTVIARSRSREYCQRKIDEMTGTNLFATVHELPIEAKKPDVRFTIGQRFGFVKDMITMMARGDQASCIVVGEGGLGKSHTVIKALNDAGMTDITTVDDEYDDYSNGDCYRVCKGYATAKAIFKTLYENRNGIVVFDDLDAALKNPESVAILKAALDSTSERRIITWRSDTRDEEVPHFFEYRGKVIFITNIPYASLDQAILSRSMVADLSMTTEQKIERMGDIIQEEEFMPEYDMEYKEDALCFISRHQDTAKELTLRTLLQVVRIRRDSPNNWEDLAEFVICR